MSSPIKWPRRSKRLAGKKIWATYDINGKLVATGEEVFQLSIPVSEWRKLHDYAFSEFGKTHGDV